MQLRMKNILSVVSITILALGATNVAGNPCDVETINTCYHALAYYEGLGFPLYGETEAKLDEMCNNINTSFACIKEFLDVCPEEPECNDECKELMLELKSFVQHTGLWGFTEEMCSPNKVLRKTYLENFQCLEKNADFYAACHNDSQMSQDFMNEFPGPDVIRDRCCFFSWYHDCFTNITRENCGVNATVFVSLSLHKLVGQTSEQLCSSINVVCDRPPLPPNRTTGVTGVTEDTLDEDKGSTIDNDVDNSLSKGPAVLHAHSLLNLLVAYCFIKLLNVL